MTEKKQGRRAAAINMAKKPRVQLEREYLALQAENERLRAALATVLGTRTHGMNMTWEERIKIGRAALATPPQQKERT